MSDPLSHADMCAMWGQTYSPDCPPVDQLIDTSAVTHAMSSAAGDAVGAVTSSPDNTFGWIALAALWIYVRHTSGRSIVPGRRSSGR